MAKYTYMKRTYLCASCDRKFTDMRWDTDPLPECRECGTQAELYFDSYMNGSSAAVHGDEIDIWIKNGICNPDGSPKRYRSKSAIRRAAADAGLVIYGETPK